MGKDTKKDAERKKYLESERPRGQNGRTKHIEDTP